MVVGIATNKIVGPRVGMTMMWGLVMVVAVKRHRSRHLHRASYAAAMSKMRW